MPLLTALGLLVVAGPCLAFPDLLPTPWRSLVTVALATIGTGVAAWTLRPILPMRLPVLLFAGVVILNAILHVDAPLVSLRHSGGIALGMLTMAVLAASGRSSTSFHIAAIATALTGLAMVLAGVRSTYFGWDGQKLVLGSVLEHQTLLYPWLPQAPLSLPGLERGGGWVNANALGGTALMVLPYMVGLAVASFRLSRLGHLSGLALGLTGTLVSLSAIWMSRSRTALLATVIVTMLVALTWRSARRPVAILLVAGAVLFAVNMQMRRVAAPRIFQAGVESTLSNLQARVTYWHLAATTIAANPVIGIGVSRFHAGPPGVDGSRPHVAHAHNVFLQVALDVGLVGLVAYLWLFGWTVVQTRHVPTTFADWIVAGATLSIVSVHVFGLTDAVALGAKVGLFQWLCAGIVMTSWSRSIGSQERHP